MTCAGAAASPSLWRLCTSAQWPLSAYGKKIGLRFCSSGMTLDNINWAAMDRIIRVDHAGEYGANRILAGQMAVLGRTSVGPVIQKMWDQEKAHLKKFSELMVAFRVRPTVLMPLWNVTGFALGAGTALLGKEGAMACTVAVEETIAHHYNNQIRTLMEEDPEKYEELLQLIKKFRDEELEHHDTGLSHDAELVGTCYDAWYLGILIWCVWGPNVKFPTNINCQAIDRSKQTGHMVQSRPGPSVCHLEECYPGRMPRCNIFIGKTVKYVSLPLSVKDGS